MRCRTDVFRPVAVETGLDVPFSGHEYEYLREWIEAMLTVPSKSLAGTRFALRGMRFDIDLGTTERLPCLPFSKLREYCCRSRINLDITRMAHAPVYVSPMPRPFDLAALGGCCTVSNPYAGVEEWFEPGKELFAVQSAEEAIERYRRLLTHDDERRRVAC